MLWNLPGSVAPSLSPAFSVPPAVLVDLDLEAARQPRRLPGRRDVAPRRERRRRRMFRRAGHPKASLDVLRTPSRSPDRACIGSSYQTQQQRELGSIDSVMPIDEVLQRRRHIAHLQVASFADLDGRIGGHVPRPPLR